MPIRSLACLRRQVLRKEFGVGKHWLLPLGAIKARTFHGKSTIVASQRVGVEMWPSGPRESSHFSSPWARPEEGLDSLGQELQMVVNCQVDLRN